MDKLKVLVVDDTLVYRKIFSEAVEMTGLGSVELTASNGLIALEWIKQREIDVVLMDVFMPEMTGPEALKIIKRDYPNIEVILISGAGPESVEVTIGALKQGAMDFILKPSESRPEKNIEILKKRLHILFTQIKLKKYSTPQLDTSAPIITPLPQVTNISEYNNVFSIKKLFFRGEADIVVIASSTGGPAALESILINIPGDFKKPILVVQHMPPEFTKILAQTLDKKCPLSVVEGYEGCLIKEGQIIIAPGGFHMTVSKGTGSIKKIQLESTPYVNGVRPAADVLFNSIAKEYEGKNILAVVLTGMGNDSMRGVFELKKACNCYCITQSEASCVVYGMPRSVYESNLSDEVVDLKDIPIRMKKAAYR